MGIKSPHVVVSSMFSDRGQRAILTQRSESDGHPNMNTSTNATITATGTNHQKLRG